MAYRWRKLLIAMVGLASVTTSLVYYYQDEVAELPDRWHTPFLNPEGATLRSPTDIFASRAEYRSRAHPINNLTQWADQQFETLMSKQSHSLAEAGAAYRNRRGRHPPPNFDKWYDFAVSQGCLMIEELFDQIYKDVEPFWAVDAAEIRKAAKVFPEAIRIRNGSVSRTTEEWHFINAYFDMLREIEHLLPDVDLPINVMDESRILVPWEEVRDLVERSSATKGTRNLPSVTSYGTLDDGDLPEFDFNWIREGPFWNIMRNSCPPDSLARTQELDTDFSTPPDFPKSWPSNTLRGFVANWTIAKDPCVHSHLRNMHGSFVEPISQSTTTKLVPMFGGSKLPANNDILLPAAVYLNADSRFLMDKAKMPWSEKRNEVLWRGIASGGRNKVNNWTRFQRHRLISILNGTQVNMTLTAQESDNSPIPSDPSNPTDTNTEPSPPSSNQAQGPLPHNFPLPDQSLYPLESHIHNLLPTFLTTISNAAFTRLVCFPEPDPQKFICDYTQPWYRQGNQMPLHRMFRAKYLPDVDGNSFSGRYRAFLQSNSLPIKATIYNEWHDDRLIAWRHFVPMDNTFVDLWAVLEYLVGHDDVAERIAVQGAEWADRVLRREDMVVYVYRLILEYARVSSDARESMGWYNKG